MVNYYLVLEKRLGDYNLVDINSLDICNTYVNNDLTKIDMFTSQFLESEIKESIKRSNTIQNDYLDGYLKVISDNKHNYKAMTKDVYLIVKEFLVDNKDINMDLKNKLFAFYKKTIERLYCDQDNVLERLKLSLKNNDKKELLDLIQALPYHKGRLIYLMIYDNAVEVLN